MVWCGGTARGEWARPGKGKGERGGGRSCDAINRASGRGVSAMAALGDGFQKRKQRLVMWCAGGEIEMLMLRMNGSMIGY